MFKWFIIICFTLFAVTATAWHIESNPTNNSQEYEDYDVHSDQLARNTIELQKYKRLTRAFIVTSIVLFAVVFIFILFLLQLKKKHRQTETSYGIMKRRIDDEIIYAEQLEEIIKELEKLTLVTRKSENAIAIFDEKGEIEWVNEGFTDLYGYTYKEFIIERGFNIVQASYSSDIKEKIKDALDTQKPKVYTTQAKNKFGIDLWIQTTLTPVLDEAGKLQNLIAIDSDITKIKKTEEDLVKYRSEMTDSLLYARRIQDAILPKAKKINKLFPDNFVLYLPKEIVSGDFYWIHSMHGKSFVAVADCTGHGVPGAFMSLIGNNLLNHIIIELCITDTNEILKKLNTEIAIALDSKRADSDTLDGMDISLIAVDHENRMFTFSGANQSIFIVHEGEIIELKGNRISIGQASEKDAKFKTHIYEFEENDLLYMFTDGYHDQFGGEHDKKFLSRRFKELISSVSELSLDEQFKVISKTFTDWKGEYEQLDDVLVMCLKLSE